MTLNRRLRRLVIAATAALLIPAASIAQSWPTKPVRIVVPVPPGGSLDILARTLAKELSPALGQPVLVENVPGAGGNIAFAQVANAAADGHTILHGWDPLAINTSLYASVPYKLSQFTPITLAITSPQVLVVNPKVPAGNLEELLALARKKPGTLSLASPGNGSPGHLAGTLLESLTGADFVHIPYKGGGPAMADLIAGHVDAAIVTLPAALQHSRGGRVKAIGVTSRTRSAGAPEIPTLAESGVRQYELNSWQGFLAPVGTPDAVIARLNREIVQILRNREVKSQLEAQGFDVVASSPEVLAQELQNGTPRWSQLVKRSGAKVD
jgi:tripartite-type tricarboxylate transporter receptor subunit TctC